MSVSDDERRLLQAQKMDALGRLAGGIAHDVNNYLAAIRTQCELLLSRARAGRADPDDVAEKMERVVGTVLKASSLVERLLAFGRRQESHPEVLNLGEVVEAFERVMAGSLASREGPAIELQVVTGRGVPPVEADLAQLEQVLANLFVNARDAIAGAGGGGPGRARTRPGGRIRIETAAVPAPPKAEPFDKGAEPFDQGAEPSGEWAVLSVADDGPGIAPEIRDQIFDPFFTTKGDKGASGLGLATVYALVEEAGGRVEVRSAPERPRGAELRVLLPPAARSARPGREGAPAAVPPPRREEGAPRGRGERILLVDDTPEVRRAVAELLESLGYRVSSAGGVVEALEVAGGAPDFDLVVTDVRLGDGSGPDLVAALRGEGTDEPPVAHPLRPLRALYLSGYTDRISLRPGAGRDESFFVKKPFSGDGLARMVRELLDRPPV
jgi:signal transduction histidine kinase